MKKHFLLLMISLFMGLSLSANENGAPELIDLKIKTTRPVGEHGGPQRSPAFLPSIYFDDTTLYFATPCDGCTLQIVDEAENICYELVIPIGTIEFDLPENLFGEYELRIIRGNTCYYGTININ